MQESYPQFIHFLWEILRKQKPGFLHIILSPLCLRKWGERVRKVKKRRKTANPRGAGGKNRLTIIFSSRIIDTVSFRTIPQRRCNRYGKNDVPAQKAPESQSAWLPLPYGYRRRTQGPRGQTRQGQKSVICLILSVSEPREYSSKRDRQGFSCCIHL